MSHMETWCIPPRYFLLFLLSAALVASVPALLAPSDVLVTPPDEPLPERVPVHVSALIEIIPSGATTFSDSHTLTLSTELQDTLWQVVVMVDGRQAAVIPRQGSVVFVNGFLLSYPTTRDVEVRVLLTGNVASRPIDDSIVVLRWAELNGRSQVVTGSEYTITQRVIPFPEYQSVPETEDTPLPSPPPMKASSSLFPVIVSFILCISGSLPDVMKRIR